MISSKVKKRIIIIFIIVMSLLVALVESDNVFLTDSKNIIGLLLSVLALCFSGISFILSPIEKITERIPGEKKNETIRNGYNILTNVEDDIMFILYATFGIILLNTFYYLDIPFFIDPHNIDLGVVKIYSLKRFIYQFGVSLFTCLSLYMLYDILRGAFLLIKGRFKG